MRLTVNEKGLARLVGAVVGVLVCFTVFTTLDYFFPDARAPDPVECPEPVECPVQVFTVDTLLKLESELATCNYHLDEYDDYVSDCYTMRQDCVRDLREAHRRCIAVCQQPGCEEECGL